MAISTSLSSLSSNVLKIQDAAQKLEITKAKATTEKLFRQGMALVGEEVRDKGSHEIPTAVLIVLGEVVGDDKIQHEFALLYSLSKTIRIFAEIILFRTYCQGGVRIKDLTKDSLISVVEEMMDFLPPREVAARFELRCAHQALNSLNTQTSYSLQIAKGVLGSSPFSTLLTLCYMIIKNDKVDQWYRRAWGVRWLASQVRTLEDLKEIEEPLSKYRKEKKDTSLYVCEILMEITESSEANEQVKKAVFQTTTPNLLALASLHGKRGSSYRETRYRAIQHLGTLSTMPSYVPSSLQSEYAKASIEAIVVQLFKSKEKAVIKQLILALYQSASNQVLWDEVLEKHKPNKIEEVNPDEDPELKSLMSTISRKHEELNALKGAKGDEIDPRLESATASERSDSSEKVASLNEELNLLNRKAKALRMDLEEDRTTSKKVFDFFANKPQKSN